MTRRGQPINEDRRQAQFAGRRVDQGKPCKNCGGTEKYVENYVCTQCARDKARNAARRKKGVSDD